MPYSNYRMIVIRHLLFENKKHRNQISCAFIISRGWENRTPTKGFGDPYHTIWPIPYIISSKPHTCLQLNFNLAFAFVELGHLATSLLSAFCFANVCLLTSSFWNARIPHSTCGGSRSSQLFGQALTLLVAVSSICYHTSTSALSTSSSSRGFTPFGWDISSWGGLHA